MDNDAKKAAKRLIHGFFDDVMIGSTVQFVEDHDKQFKQFGSELADDKQQRTQFLGLVSHELRTPLTPILLDLAILEKDGRVADQLRPALTRIRHNVEVETALIDDLLDATRLTQGSLELRLEDVDMHKLLLSEITACELNYLDKQLNLEVLLQATAITGTGDGTRLRRAFAALLKNAANVSQTGTRVTVRSRNIDEGHSIEIEFQDTGSDLDGELVDRVFVPFDQGRPSTFGIGRLGVGRYVAKAVIEAHSGTLLAKRGATGGAAYVVTLPVRP